MNFLLLPPLLGLVLGLRHAFEPDHIAAVAALLGRGGRERPDEAARVGMFWGAGHASSLLLAGGGVILLGWRIPPRFGALLECAVALVLILMGGSILLRRLRGDRAHLHLHEHGGLLHAHLHFHRSDDDGHQHHAAATLLSPGRRPFLVGMLHGLAGTGGATMLVLAAAPSPVAALGTLALFGAGTMLGMALVSRFLGLPLAAAARRSSALHSGLLLASGAVSLALGLFLALHFLPNL